MTKLILSKPVFGLALGAVLGAVDSLTALMTPEVAPKVTEIMFWSGMKGLIAGLIIGFFASKVHSLRSGILFGSAIGALLALLVAAFPDEAGNHYWLEITIPSTVEGAILGFATQKFCREVKPATN
jgi:MFS family permease